MNKKTIIVFLVVILLCVVVWIALGIIVHDYVLPYDYFHVNDGTSDNSNNYLDYLNVTYVAVGAMCTGLAFAITLYGLYIQNKELHKQNRHLSQKLTLNVFTDAFGHVLDNERFREAQQYIHSSQFPQDVDTLVAKRSPFIKELLQEAREKYNIPESPNYSEIESVKVEMTDNEILYKKRLAEIRSMDEYKKIKRNICIEDFREILSISKKTSQENSSSNVIVSCKSYERIRYFCDRMDYLGIVYHTYKETVKNEKNNAEDENLIVNYFGYNITSSYCLLKPFIESSQSQEGGNHYYNFSYLNKETKEKYSKYIAKIKNEL